MSKMPWFRMYADFLNDPKMISLAFEDQRHFIGVLALKCDGALDDVADGDYTCQYCGVRGTKLECDHKHPVARGGSHDDENLVTACRTCNRSKRDKLITEWRPA